MWEYSTPYYIVNWQFVHRSFLLLAIVITLWQVIYFHIVIHVAVERSPYQPRLIHMVFEWWNRSKYWTSISVLLPVHSLVHEICRHVVSTSCSSKPSRRVSTHMFDAVRNLPHFYLFLLWIGSNSYKSIALTCYIISIEATRNPHRMPTDWYNLGHPQHLSSIQSGTRPRSDAWLTLDRYKISSMITGFTLRPRVGSTNMLVAGFTLHWSLLSVVKCCMAIYFLEHLNSSAIQFVTKFVTLYLNSKIVQFWSKICR